MFCVFGRPFVKRLARCYRTVVLSCLDRLYNCEKFHQVDTKTDQTAGWIKMPFGTKVSHGPHHIVLDWEWGSSSPRKGAQHPPLSRFTAQPMPIVAKRLEWIKIPLGAEVGLCPSDVGPSPRHGNGTAAATFRSMSATIR